MSTSSPFRILCVDDEAAGLNLRLLILQRKGYEVSGARTVSEALALFQSRDCDLVITDHLLGRDTGTAMARGMKHLKPNVPILMLSGAADTPEDTETIDGFISKAEGIETLLAEVDQLAAQAGANAIRSPDAPQKPSAEAVSTESHHLLAAIVESSDDAILSKTLDGAILSWNKAAEQMYGYRAEEIIGKPISILLPPDRTDEEHEILQRLQRGEKIEHFETVRMAKDGHLLTVSLTISPVRDSTGRVVAASTIARDITRAKLAEESLCNSEKLAVAGRMAATVAHEINNPLEAVTNALYLLSDSPSLDTIAREFLRTAQEELAQVRQIVAPTLGQHRGDTESPQMLRVSELIDNVLGLYDRKLPTLGVRVERRYDDDVLVNVYPGELRQVFANLIINAADALEESGEKLFVHAFASRNWKNPHQRGLRVTISDNGCGIPADKRAHLFQPFYTTKGSKGTGIGLWVSMSIVQKYGGTIRFRSTVRPAERCGTTFSVFLPLPKSA